MNKDELIEQVKYQARLIGVDPILACAVAEQESGWDTWAIRYEPAFFTRYVAPQVNLSDTERHARAFSWGLFQVMGQVARERGYTGEFLSSLCLPENGIAVGLKFLKHLLDISEGDETKALLKWNGGGRPEYATEVLARKSHYT